MKFKKKLKNDWNEKFQVQEKVDVVALIGMFDKTDSDFDRPPEA